MFISACLSSLGNDVYNVMQFNYLGYLKVTGNVLVPALHVGQSLRNACSAGQIYRLLFNLKVHFYVKRTHNLS